MEGLQTVAQADIFTEPFLLVALGAWAAISLGFLGQVYDKVTYTTRLLLSIGVLAHIAGTLALWAWAFLDRQKIQADVLAFVGIVLPVAGLIAFAIGLLRPK